MNHLPKLLQNYLPVHGFHNYFDDSVDYDYRLKENFEAKARIARLIIADLLPQRMGPDIAGSILLDSGSVTYNVANQIAHKGDIGIVTNNIAIHQLYEELKVTPARDCRLLQGEMLRKVLANGGTEAAHAAQIELTKKKKGAAPTRVAVLGLRAYSPEKGITEDFAQLSEFQAALMNHAEHLIVVAQGEKFLKQANMPILNSKSFHYMMDKRKEEKSLWFVYHQPTVKMNEIERSRYEKNRDDFLQYIPEDRVFDSTSVRVDPRFYVRKERFRSGKSA